jgi:phosphatidylglycerophosphatase A
MKLAPLWQLVATWFGAGNAPFMSGTVGSLAALPFAFLIQLYLGSVALLVSAVLVFFWGWWASVHYLRHNPENQDPKAIVVDEVAGQWLLLSFLPFTWQGYLVGFFLFRIFDIIKPWPVSFADSKVKGALGVMLDDILAALYPVVVYFALTQFAPTISNAIYDFLRGRYV